MSPISEQDWKYVEERVWQKIRRSPACQRFKMGDIIDIMKLVKEELVPEENEGGNTK